MTNSRAASRSPALFAPQPVEALHVNVANAITTFVMQNYLMRLTLGVKNPRLQQFAPS
jgi:hypothetical protein